MKTGGLLEWGKVADARQSGPPPGGFRIAPGNLMTRPATAMMLFEIHSDPTPPTRQSALIASMLQLGLRHKGNDVTEAYFVDQIAFCVEKAYLETSPADADGDFRLKTATRIDAELIFIDKLRRFAHVSRIVRSATGKEKFERREESAAFVKFLASLNLLPIDEFGGWLTYTSQTLVPATAGAEVDFKAGAGLVIIERLNSSLNDFRT